MCNCILYPGKIGGGFMKKTIIGDLSGILPGIKRCYVGLAVVKYFDIPEGSLRNAF